MARKEIEDKIAQAFFEIVKMARDYYPDDHYLTCHIVRDDEEDRDSICFNNSYFDHKEDGVIKGHYIVKGGELIDRTIRKDY